MHKDMKKLIKSTEAQGFTVRISTKGHILFSYRGRRVATASGSPSDPRAWANLISELRKALLDDQDGSVL